MTTLGLILTRTYFLQKIDRKIQTQKKIKLHTHTKQCPLSIKSTAQLHKAQKLQSVKSEYRVNSSTADASTIWWRVGATCF